MTYKFSMIKDLCMMLHTIIMFLSTFLSVFVTVSSASLVSHEVFNEDGFLKFFFCIMNELLKEDLVRIGNDFICGKLNIDEVVR